MMHKTSLQFLMGLLLMMVLGVNSAWGQSDGMYYIANNNDKNPFYNPESPSTNYYLVPASDGGEDNININTWAWTENSATPFVTTFKTNKDNNSIWIVKESDTSGEYYLIHVLTGKYMTLNTGVGSNSNRRTFHLETTSTLGNAHLFNFTTHTGTPTFYSIKPKSLSAGHRFLNPSKANQDKYYGTTIESNYAVGGLIGTYNKDASGDVGYKWYLEPASILLAPTINDVSSSTGRATVTENNGLPAGYNIRYTTDGTDPDANSPIMEADGYQVTESCTLKVVIERYGLVLTGVAEKAVNPVPCVAPAISFDYTTSMVSITSIFPTSGGTIYYTTDGSNPTEESTEYDGPFSVTSPTTVKAIVTHSVFTTSEPAELSISQVATPTIQNNGSNAISITCATPDATIYYTTDGSTPSTSSTE